MLKSTHCAGSRHRRLQQPRRPTSLGLLLAVVIALLASLFGPIGVGSADAAGPYTPRNVRGESAGQDGIKIDWDAPPSPVASYRIYLMGSLIDETPFLGTFIGALAPETTYTVGIAGVAASGQQSPRVNIEVGTADRNDLEVFFWDNEIRVSEGDGFVETVIANGQSFGEYINPGGVSSATRALSATPGSDFYGKYTVEDDVGGFGEVRYFQVDILDDDIVEPDETFEIRLFKPTRGAVLVDDGSRYRTLRVTIVDDDEPADLEPVWVYLDTSLVGEGWNNQLELVAVHSDAAPLPRNGFSIDVSTVGESAQPGSDFYGFFKRVDFPPGVDRVQIPITVLDDVLTEGEETLRIRMFRASNDRIKFDRQGPIRIRDNDE